MADQLFVALRCHHHCDQLITVTPQTFAAACLQHQFEPDVIRQVQIIFAAATASGIQTAAPTPAARRPRRQSRR